MQLTLWHKQDIIPKGILGISKYTSTDPDGFLLSIAPSALYGSMFPAATSKDLRHLEHLLLGARVLRTHKT